MPTQKYREIAIGTPLGEDVLLLISFSGTEQLGRLFEYNLELASEDYQIEPENIIGQNVSIHLNLVNGGARYFNGYVSHFTQVTTSDQLARYKATVVPWFWFLTRVADCRIFQEKTVPEIIEQIFRDRGFTDFENGLSGEYRKWEYCVQYRETDFNFISRLMEQEGIYYFFKHDNGKHSLVLADSASAHEPYPDFDQLEYHPADKGTISEECISDWIVETQLQSCSFALNDFDFKNPQGDLQARKSISRGHAAADFEIYDYPGKYTKTSEGEDYTKKRIEEIQAQYEVATAGSDSRGICAGYTLSLTEHPREDQNDEYLITSVEYHIEGGESFSSDAEDGQDIVSCVFTAIKKSQPFRSPRITPKTKVSGPQTALVVGPEGEEIYTDKYGRVKVKFHWDHYAEGDENSSCWIRVAQLWAGKNWGAMYIPRVGQEVIVDFLEGDPDRPIITGRVYNEQAMPPYGLPDNKTISTLKSKSYEGGGFNEIRFEDLWDREQIYIHAQNNLDIRVNHDRYETVGTDDEGSRHLVVEVDKKEHIKNCRHEKVDHDHIEEIGNDRHLKVTGKEAKQVDGSKSLMVKGDVIEVFKDNHAEQVTNDYYLKGDNVVIEAMTNVTIKVGQSFIAIESGGIKIGTMGTLELESKGPLTVKGTAGVKVESPAIVEAQGKTTLVKGSVAVQVQGGVVKIN
ncbi:MAG: type VI secretion system Vgr family protein [Planctomycetota bacterium]|jgi:type VI secretion system secreted protein VgrG